MLLLPPAASAAQIDPRPARRVSDRRKRAAEAAGAAGAEEQARAYSVPPTEKAERRSRKWGRRASDAQSGSASGEDDASSRRPRAYAPLVAQLIATALGVEQTRARRRGKVEDALALYLRRVPKVKPRGEA